MARVLQAYQDAAPSASMWQRLLFLCQHSLRHHECFCMREQFSNQ